jgi:hypothetical protein
VDSREGECGERDSEEGSHGCGSGSERRSELVARRLEVERIEVREGQQVDEAVGSRGRGLTEEKGCGWRGSDCEQNHK